MRSTEPEELPRRHSNEELLDQIYAHGGRYRRRRRRMVGTSLVTGVLALVAGVGVMARLPGPGAPQDVAARGVAAPAIPGSSTTTTVEPLELPPEVSISVLPPQSPLPTVAPGAVIAAGGSGGGATPTTAPPPAPSAEPEPSPPSAATAEPTPETRIAGGATGVAPALAATGEGGPSSCLNSTDAACGPFRWETEPGPNAPLAVTVKATPRADDPRTFDFFVVYSDPDASIRDDCRMSDFGDGGTAAASGCAVAACVATYGPWTPPAKEPGYAEARTSHTFAAPGTHTVRFSASSGGVCGHPYASTGTGSTEVVVPA